MGPPAEGGREALNTRRPSIPEPRATPAAALIPRHGTPNAAGGLIFVCVRGCISMQEVCLCVCATAERQPRQFRVFTFNYDGLFGFFFQQ